MKRFRQARDRGYAYLLWRQQEDGSFADPDVSAVEYHKVPLAFQVCGETNAANRLLDWIRTHGLTPDGDIMPRPDKALGEYFYAYYNAWIVIGAQRLGQFDLAEQSMDFLMDFWDPEGGGFYSSLTDREDDTKQDLWVVAQCGRAALYTGRIDIARGVGVWMDRLLRAQPNYPKEMYPVYSRAEGLITHQYPKDDIRYVVRNDAEQDQFFFHPGISGGFLARLSQATEEETWLDLAKEYMRFAEGANNYLLGLPCRPARWLGAPLCFTH